MWITRARGYAQLASQLDKSFFPVLQGFGANFTQGGVNRYPTTGELRFMTFSSIAATGARGSMFWGYNPAAYTTGDGYEDFIEDTVQPVFDKLNLIEHAMNTGFDAGNVSLYSGSPSQDVSGLVLYDAQLSQYFLILTLNEDSNSIDIEITLSGLEHEISSTQIKDEISGQVINMTSLGNNEYRFDVGMSDFGVRIFSIK